MKKTLVMLALMSTAALCFGQVADSSREADHAMLRDLKDKVTTAINNRDVKALAAYCTKDFALTLVDQTTIASEDQLKEYFARMFDKPGAIVADMKCEIKPDVLTKFIDDKSAYCYGASVETYKMKDGFNAVMNGRWTATMVKQNGEWRIAAAHTGVNLLDNPVLKRTISFGRMLAGVGLAAGFLIGLLVMWILKRKKSS